MSKKLLNIDANAKTVKGQKKGYMTGILYLAPAKLSGYEVCPMRSPGCTASCLNTAGRGIFSTTQKARIGKTIFFFADKLAFEKRLETEIVALKKKAFRNGFEPCIRLNGTSDISWEKQTSLMQTFPDTQYYDYTKNNIRMMEFLAGTMPKNYHLTFSLNEANLTQALEVLQLGGNVAVVFNTKKGKALPKAWNGFKVVDGDISDLRFLDKKGVVVGLRAKGKARKVKAGGFVQESDPELLVA
jgi:hypothetical protein